MVRSAVKAKTPICATRAEPRQVLPGQRLAGFTLVELLVALALVGLMLALVPASLGRLRDSIRYRDTVRAVVSDLRAARQIALVEGRETRFLVDTAQSRFGLDGRPLQALPEPLQMRATVASIEWSQDRQAAIRFLPQGGATGGSVDVLRPGGDGVRITVDWLSAAVSQTPITP